jgi:hemolysin D
MSSQERGDELEALRLETRPAPTLPLIMAASISGLTLAVVAAIALVPVTQVLSVPGRLVTRRSTQTITSPQPGVVTEVLVREGQAVKAGQALLELDPRQERTAVLELERQLSAGRDVERNERLKLGDRIASLRRRLELDLSILRPLQALAREGGSSVVQVREQERVVENTRRELAESERALDGLAFQAEESRAQLRRELQASRTRLELDLSILRPLQALAREGGSSVVQVREQERVVENTRRELAESERALDGLAFQAEESRAQLRRELQASRTRLERITLRAPVAGDVLDLRAQSGQVAGPDVPLLKLVPRADLQAEARVNNRDLAFVQPGQSAMVSLLAYDPSTYGQLKATVIGVGRDALPPQGPGEEAHFPISLELASQVLERQGRRFELQPGMALEAQLQLKRVTLLQLIFSKLNRGMDAVRSLR